jgi:hypothetical protein
MNRRTFFSAMVLGILTGKALAKYRSHTDALYAHVEKPAILSPNAHPRPSGSSLKRDDFIPYLNGKAQKGVQEANAEEGWMNIKLRQGSIVRKYGDVQLLWITPERRAEFEAVPEVM